MVLAALVITLNQWIMPGMVVVVDHTLLQVHLLATQEAEQEYKVLDQAEADLELKVLELHPQVLLAQAVVAVQREKV